jgi:NAD(P)-dependent dehydrogenase (short-subunit alcohol dehydrogenase family)
VDFSLDGKRTLVTGGTHGIGLAVARRFAERGAEVVITGRRAEGEEIAKQIGGRFIRADFSNDGDIEALFSALSDAPGALDVLINNAGFGIEEGPNQTVDLDDVDRILQVNLRAVILSMKLATPLLTDGASVINTSSISGLQGEPMLSTYGLSKAALNSFTRSMACELAPRRIRVNAVCPGPVETAYWQPDDPQMPIVDYMMPLARVPKAEEIAPLYQYLAADESAMLTGQWLVYDGGFTAGIALQLAPKLGVPA